MVAVFGPFRFRVARRLPCTSSLRLSLTATTANRWNRCRCGWLLNIIGNQALMLRFPLLMPLVSDCPHRPASVWYAYCPLRSDEVCSRIWGQGVCVRSPVSEVLCQKLRFLRSGFLRSGFLCLGLKVASLELRVPSPSSKSQIATIHFSCFLMCIFSDFYQIGKMLEGAESCSKCRFEALVTF